MNKILLTALGVLVIVGGAMTYLFFSSSLSTPATTADLELSAASEVPIEQPTPNAQGLSTYTDEVYNFSLSYLSQYRVGKFSDGAGDTVVLQDNAGVGIQLVITAFDENIVLTAARIKQDLPDLVMTDVREVLLPTAGIPAVVFKSKGGGFGDSIELWFVHEGYLYQASSYLSQLPFLEGVMGTFVFK